MARPARFSDDDVLDAAARAFHAHGHGVSLAQVASELGGPTGSIYHRFASRDDLLTALWLRSIRRFHGGLMDAYALPDPREALLAATRHIPRYCRERPVDALAMTLYRQPVLAGTASARYREDVEHVNDEVDAAMRRLVPARYGEPSERGYRLIWVGTRLSPYGLVRPFVGSDVPDWLDDVCVASARGILALGD